MLTPTQKLELYYWMRLTRTFDDQAMALWKQGRGVGGVYSQRGHEAIGIGAAFALEPDDLIAPMHRDLGAYLLRGMHPRSIMANLLGRATGVTRGRDANFHGLGDMSLGIAGFVSHLPQSLPVALGLAMSFVYRQQPRVALTFTGDGASSTGLFHETLNLAAVFKAPFVLIVENNQYAYSTPVTQQMAHPDIADRADGFGVPKAIIDGNDVEAVYAAVKTAVDRARSGGGPTLIEAKTMRMLGHAIHDGAEYVPKELLAEWAAKDPIDRFTRRLLDEGVTDQVELDEIDHRAAVEVEDAVQFAESSLWPDPATVEEGVYAD